MTLDGTLSNVISKHRLIIVKTKGEEDMLVAKFEAGAAENFGRFSRNIPRLELLN